MKIGKMDMAISGGPCQGRLPTGELHAGAGNKKKAAPKDGPP